MEQKQRFSVSAAPHIFARSTTAVLMRDVLTALIAPVVAGVWFSAETLLHCSSRRQGGTPVNTACVPHHPR